MSADATAVVPGGRVMRAVLVVLIGVAIASLFVPSRTWRWRGWLLLIPFLGALLVLFAILGVG
jgi:hypothetical protein